MDKSLTTGGSGHSGNEELVRIVEEVVEECGLKVFDIEVPTYGSSGILRVLICKEVSGEQKDGASSGAEQKSTVGNVNLDDCARVSSRLTTLDEERDFIPSGVLLEVSSPGVNRRLKNRRHFVGAVGERVRVTFHNGDFQIGEGGRENSPANLKSRPKGKQTVRGILEAVDQDLLRIQVESGRSKKKQGGKSSSGKVTATVGSDGVKGEQYSGEAPPPIMIPIVAVIEAFVDFKFN